MCYLLGYIMFYLHIRLHHVLLIRLIYVLLVRLHHVLLIRLIHVLLVRLHHVLLVRLHHALLIRLIHVLLVRLHHVLRADSPWDGWRDDWVRALPPLDGRTLRTGTTDPSRNNLKQTDFKFLKYDRFWNSSNYHVFCFDHIICYMIKVFYTQGTELTITVI